jgi:hypothetical protein
MRRIILAGLTALSFCGAAEAMDQWTRDHSDRFVERWAHRTGPNGAGGPQWRKEMVQQCKEGEIHQVEIGVDSLNDAVEKFDRCNEWNHQ